MYESLRNYRQEALDVTYQALNMVDKGIASYACNAITASARQYDDWDSLTSFPFDLDLILLFHEYLSPPDTKTHNPWWETDEEGKQQRILGLFFLIQILETEVA